jgi:hypothetical protein
MYFRNRKWDYLKEKLMSLQRTVRTRTTDLNRIMNESERGYQLRNSLVQDENGDLVADSHNTFNRWRSYFSQLLNVHNVSDVRQIEEHTA